MKIFDTLFNFSYKRYFQLFAIYKNELITTKSVITIAVDELGHFVESLITDLKWLLTEKENKKSTNASKMKDLYKQKVYIWWSFHQKVTVKSI